MQLQFVNIAQGASHRINVSQWANRWHDFHPIVMRLFCVVFDEVNDQQYVKIH